eukprot:SAG31_NODE_35517_length_322_cov_0.856502_1_plen_96_part_10
MVDTFSISALHLSIKVPYFSNSGHTNEKATTLTWLRKDRSVLSLERVVLHDGHGLAAQIRAQTALDLHVEALARMRQPAVQQLTIAPPDIALSDDK